MCKLFLGRNWVDSKPASMSEMREVLLFQSFEENIDAALAGSSTLVLAQFQLKLVHVFWNDLPLIKNFKCLCIYFLIVSTCCQRARGGFLRSSGLFRGLRGESLSFLLQPVEKASAEREREAERERDRHSPFGQRHLHTHHHTHVGMGYPLIPGQYDPFQGQQLCLTCASVHPALENRCQNCLPCLQMKRLSFEWINSGEGFEDFFPGISLGHN